MTLPVCPPYQDREGAVGLAWRAARLNDFTNTDEFAKAFQNSRTLPIKRRDIVAGDPVAVDHLGQLCGFEAEQRDRLALWSGLPDTTGYRRFGCVAVPAKAMRTLLPPYCPLCHKEDVATGSRGEWLRAEWFVEGVRICVEHACALALGSARCSWTAPRGGSIRLVAPNSVDETALTHARALKGWMERGEQPAGTYGLDFIRYDRLCVVVGLQRIASSAHVTRERIDLKTAAEAAGVGSLVLRTDGITGHFEYLRACRASTSQDVPLNTFGALLRLARAWRNEGVGKGITRRMAAFAVGNMPFEKGATFLGRKIDEPRFVTFGALRDRTGLTPRVLKRKLITEGVMDEGAWTCSVPVAVADRLVPARDDLIDERIARKRMGVDANALDQFVRAGTITPVDTVSEGDLKGARFAMGDVAAFLEEHVVRFPELEAAPPGHIRLRDCRWSYRVGLLDLLPELAAGRLPGTVRLAGFEGVSSLRYAPTEVEALPCVVAKRRERCLSVRRLHPVLTAKDVAETLGIGHYTARALLRSGRLGSDVAEFHATYVGYAELWKRLGVAPSQLRRLLTKHGIGPAFPRDHVGALYYRRSVVSVIDPSLATPRFAPQVPETAAPSASLSGKE